MSAENFWDREVSTPTHTSWMEDPRVREYILRKLDGMWPVDFFLRKVGSRRFGRGLSIGCGTGPFERDIIRKNLVDRVDAFDGSTNSLRIARDLARKEGMLDRVRYFAADFNEPFLPRRAYDIIFIHQALHHVAKLEKLLRSVMLSLKRGGVLYLDEYIGPSRTDWTDALIESQRAYFDKLPDDAKRMTTLPLPIQDDDPSEAIRSSEIMTQLRIGFDVREFRGYGGNLLSVLYPAVDFTRTPIDRAISEEERLIAEGQRTFYAVIVATPKRGTAKLLASWRYFTEPKLKRVVREVKARFTRKSKP